MWRNSFTYLLILVAVIAIVVAFFRPSTPDAERRDLSTFLRDAREGRVQRVVVLGDILEVTLQGGDLYQTRKEAGQSVLEVLRLGGVEDPAAVQIAIQRPSQFADWVGLMIQFIPILIFIGLVLFMMRQTRAPHVHTIAESEIGVRRREGQPGGWGQR